MRKPTLILLIVFSMILTGAILKTLRGKRLKDILLILPENATEAEKGEVVYLRKCAGCHDGTNPTDGPPLPRIYREKGDAWMRRYARDPKAHDPNAYMPPFNLSDTEEQWLLAYIRGRT